MDFVEIRTQTDREQAFRIIKELIPGLDRPNFFNSLDHEFSNNHKLFGLRRSGKLICVAAVWFLMTGLNERLFWINVFVTTASMRSKGYGRTFLEALEAYAKKYHFNEIRVHAHRERAIHFWQLKANFEKSSQILRKKVGV